MLLISYNAESRTRKNIHICFASRLNWFPNPNEWGEVPEVIHYDKHFFKRNVNGLNERLRYRRTTDYDENDNPIPNLSHTHEERLYPYQRICNEEVDWDYDNSEGIDFKGLSPKEIFEYDKAEKKARKELIR